MAQTRSRHGGRCVGVDPNRNWGHYWGGKVDHHHVFVLVIIVIIKMVKVTIIITITITSKTNSSGQGASADACSEIYRGPRAFSEPETQAVRNFILDRLYSYSCNMVK